MICKNCGKEIPKDTNVCPECGDVAIMSTSGYEGKEPFKGTTDLEKEEPFKGTTDLEKEEPFKSSTVLEGKEPVKKKISKKTVIIAIIAVVLVLAICLTAFGVRNYKLKQQMNAQANSTEFSDDTANKQTVASNDKENSDKPKTTEKVSSTKKSNTNETTTGGKNKTEQSAKKKKNPVDLSGCKTGDIITFGLYPQSKVTDSSLISRLNRQPKTWISYGYYSGNGEDGSMKKGDWMKYADITYNGKKYRAVTFSQYRPDFTEHENPVDNESYQKENGYSANATYWFKYEPLKWRVLDPTTGLIMCENVIDAQCYSNTAYESGEDYYNDSGLTNYANDYSTSSIREWLNSEFYNIAFRSDEKSYIKNTTLDNSCPTDSKYDSETTVDKVFLLSYNEVKNREYGFMASEYDYDPARQAHGTEYALAQGLFRASNGYSFWWLRSPDDAIYASCFVGDDGYSAYKYSTVNSCTGIRPAIRIGM